MLRGQDVYVYDAAHMLIVSVDLPVAAQVTHASQAEPFLCFRLDLDQARIAELVLKVYPYGLPQAHEKRAKATRPAYNLAGYPPAAKEGYIDGCESAKHTQYAHKDAKRMAEDAQYEMGWKDGFGICAKK